MKVRSQSKIVVSVGSSGKAWFGPEVIDEVGCILTSSHPSRHSLSKDPYVFRRVMTNKLPIAQHKASSLQGSHCIILP